MRSVAFGFLFFLLGAGILPAGSARAFADHLFVVTSNGINAGNCASLELSPPWPATTDLEATSVRPNVRHFAGLHYAVNAEPVHDLQIIDPETFQTVRRIPFAGKPNPRDVLVLEDGTAYVSFFDSAK